MKTLRMLTVIVFAAAAAAASAAEDSTVPTITVTAKRHETVPATERVPPRADIAITLIMPTDMPEADIDYHVSPISVPHADRRASEVLTP